MQWISSLIARIREWYRGRKVPAGPGVYSRGRLVFQRERYEQPPLAKALRIIARFWLGHWQWIIGTILAVIGLFLALA